MNNLSTTPTNEIMLELYKLQKEIDLKLARHNLLVDELHKRYPMLKEESTIQKGEVKCIVKR